MFRPAFKTIIGLEIHSQLDTESKMFCACDNDSEGAGPNTNICPICLGHPGVLPVPNKKALKLAVQTAKALNCQISEETRFERKNYFYPDLPKGYQISQSLQPIARNGYLEIAGRKVRINRLHLEEDAAKLVHDEKNKNYSLIDFNRSGTPLMEIVTEPDLTSPAEATDFLRELRLIARYLKVSRADMEKGHLRCDANVSVNFNRPNGVNIQSPITEIKNLNSFKAVAKALSVESARLYEEYQNCLVSPKLTKTTAHWDQLHLKTIKSRDKEETADYRYFPEPDIPSINTKDFSEVLEVELPRGRRIRFKKEYELTDKDIETLVVNKVLGDYFEKAVSELGEWNKSGVNLAKKTAAWLLSELQKLLKFNKISLNKCLITPENFAEFIKIIDRGEINSTAGQIVLKEMLATGQDPSQIIAEKSLAQVSDIAEVALVASEVIAANESVVEQIKSGKETALQFLLGQMMAGSKGKINPRVALKVLKDKIFAKK